MVLWLSPLFAKDNTTQHPASTLSVRWHPSTGVDSSSGCAEVQTPQTLGYLTLSVTAGVKHL